VRPPLEWLVDHPYPNLGWLAGHPKGGDGLQTIPNLAAGSPRAIPKVIKGGCAQPLAASRGGSLTKIWLGVACEQPQR
jgi:hypothetical protein